MDKNEFLTPRVLGILGLVIATVAILIPILQSYYSKARSAVSYEIVSKSVIGDTSNSSSIKVSIDERLLDRVCIYTVQLSNSGTEPLREPDYQVPIFIRFTPQTVIYRTNIVETVPNNLSITTWISDNNVGVSPTLLNPDDRFLIQIICSDCDSVPEVTARIAGVREIQKESTDDDDKRWRFFPFVMIMVIISLTNSTILLSADLYKPTQKRIRILGRVDHGVAAIISLVFTTGFVSLFFVEYFGTSFWSTSTIGLLIQLIAVAALLPYRKRVLKRFTDEYTRRDQDIDESRPPD